MHACNYYYYPTENEVHHDHHQSQFLICALMMMIDVCTYLIMECRSTDRQGLGICCWVHSTVHHLHTPCVDRVPGLSVLE